MFLILYFDTVTAMYIKVFYFSALFALTSSEFPLDNEELLYQNDVDESIYRLPEDLDPIHCEVEITPYFEATADREAFTFDGIVTIKLRVSSVTIFQHQI